MNTYFLKFPDEQTAIQNLSQYYNDIYGWLKDSHSHSLDPVGIIVIPAQYDENGIEIVPPTYLSGWHINFIGDLPENCLPFLVNPINPYRVFYV